MNYILRASAMLGILTFGSVANADSLPKRTGNIVLTIDGLSQSISPDSSVQFDLEMLKSLPMEEFTTTTIWTEGPQKFTGVSLFTLVNTLEMQGSHLKASAINDYHVTIPLSDAVENGPIVAYLRNDAPMTVREKGPLWIIYPFDADVKYQAEAVYARSIWQLDHIEIIP